MRKSFHAKCRLATTWEPVPAALQEAWQAHLAKSIPYNLGTEAVEAYRAEKERLEAALAPWSTYDKKRGEHGRLVPCDFEFTDPYLFDQHMADVHRAPKTRPPRRKRPPMWKGPKLTEDGTPFEPKDLEPGATVTWRELVPTGEVIHHPEYHVPDSNQVLSAHDEVVSESIERAGQVWSAGPFPKSAWVVPFELLEGERCVLIALDRDGTAYYRQTWTARDAERAA